MDARVFGLTRKQAGVIFKNYKQGNLNLTDADVKFLYDSLVGDSYPDATMQDVYSKAHKAVDACFAEDYEEAEKQFRAAEFVYHINYKEA